MEERKFSEEEIDLIRRTVARNCTDDELAVFLHSCARCGLDPLLKQIHAIHRSDRDRGQQMTIQVGIDGLRIIAERTGRYAPGRPTEYQFGDGGPIAATAFVRKQTHDGTWHDVGATAYYSEYCGRKNNGEPNRMWQQFPAVMLAKCAEAAALRRAFPVEASGLYTFEEMDQAENGGAAPSPAAPMSAMAVTNHAPSPATEHHRDQPVATEGSEVVRRRPGEWHISAVTERSGNTRGKDWIVYTVDTLEGDKFSTFDERLAAIARTLVGKVAACKYKETPKGWSLESIEEVFRRDETHAEPEPPSEKPQSAQVAIMVSRVEECRGQNSVYWQIYGNVSDTAYTSKLAIDAATANDCLARKLRLTINYRRCGKWLMIDSMIPARASDVYRSEPPAEQRPAAVFETPY